MGQGVRGLFASRPSPDVPSRCFRTCRGSFHSPIEKGSPSPPGTKFMFPPGNFIPTGQPLTVSRLAVRFTLAQAPVGWLRARRPSRRELIGRHSSAPCRQTFASCRVSKVSCPNLQVSSSVPPRLRRTRHVGRPVNARTTHIGLLPDNDPLPQATKEWRTGPSKQTEPSLDGQRWLALSDL